MDLETNTQSDSVIFGIQSRYSATKILSNKNYILTATDKFYSRQFSYTSESAISDNNYKSGFFLVFYKNQNQRTFEPLNPSIFVSWPELRSDIFYLPAQIKSSANKEFGDLDILDKEISRSSLLYTVSIQKVEEYDEDWENIFIFIQYNSQFVPLPIYSWISVDTKTEIQKSTKTDQLTTSLSTSIQKIQKNSAISRINWSIQISKQNIELIFGSIVEDSLVFVSIVFLYCLVLQFLYRKNERLQSFLVQRKNSLFRKPDIYAAEIAEVSYF